MGLERVEQAALPRVGLDAGRRCLGEQRGSQHPPTAALGAASRLLQVGSQGFVGTGRRRHPVSEGTLTAKQACRPPVQRRTPCRTEVVVDSAPDQRVHERDVITQLAWDLSQNRGADSLLQGHRRVVDPGQLARQAQR